MQVFRKNNYSINDRSGEPNKLIMVKKMVIFVVQLVCGVEHITE